MSEGNDMIDEEILAPLRVDPPGQPAIDITRAMAEGGRLRRRRQWTGGVAVAAAVTLAAVGGAVTTRRHAAPVPVATTPPPTSCSVVALPTGDGSRTEVTAGDPTGYLLGGQLPGNANLSQPIIWKNGVIVARPRVTGAGAPQFTAINRRGVAVGTGMQNQTYQAYILRDGQVAKLPGVDSAAAAINDAEVIVGSLGDRGFDSVPARWSSPDTAPQKLAVPAGWSWGLAQGIAADGTIWGQFGRGPVRGQVNETGVLWLPDGTVRQLTLPAAIDGSGHSFEPTALAGGWLYGDVAGIGPNGLRARYNIAENRFEKLPDLYGSTGAYADNGWAPGYTSEGTGPKTTFAPILMAGTTMVRLPQIRTEPFTFIQMSGISRDGHVIAGSALWSDKAGARGVALVWTCK